VEKLARSVAKEEKLWVKLIFSIHLLERISQVASTPVSHIFGRTVKGIVHLHEGMQSVLTFALFP
jgi:hypothetical protein